MPLLIFAVAVNPILNRIYVANQTSNDVTIINGANNTTMQTVNTGTFPVAVAVNPATNRIYVGISGGISVIDGANNSIVTTITAASGNFNSIAVNPVTNRIYAASNNLSRLYVINGADNTAQVLQTGDDTLITVAVNPATNKFYVGGQTLVQFDGVTNINQIFGATAVQDIAVNVRTDQFFVVLPFNNSVISFSPTPSVTVPLSTTVAPLNANNTTTVSMPTFNLTATTTTAPAPRNIYYQFDTKQGEWRRAVPTGSTETILTATAVAPFLYNGIHTIYFFATDGTDSTSINPLFAENSTTDSSRTMLDFGEFAPDASAVTGQIGSYQFLVAAPLAPTAAGVSVGGRVMRANGIGIGNALVTLTKSNGESQIAFTSSFGYYRFVDIPAGETYIFSVLSKRYTFNPNTQVRSIFEETNDVNFVTDNLWKRD